MLSRSRSNELAAKLSKLMLSHRRSNHSKWHTTDQWQMRVIVSITLDRPRSSTAAMFTGSRTHSLLAAGADRSLCHSDSRFKAGQNFVTWAIALTLSFKISLLTWHALLKSTSHLTYNLLSWHDTENSVVTPTMIGITLLRKSSCRVSAAFKVVALSGGWHCKHVKLSITVAGDCAAAEHWSTPPRLSF